MKYIYQARSKEGKMETGTVEASSREAAAVLLQKYNIYVTSIKEEAREVFRLSDITFLERISKKDLAVFSRQLALMLESRVPVVQSLKSLALQTKKKGFKEKILEISRQIEEGNPLSEAFATFPGVFDIFYINLVKTGEASGKISESLDYLSEHYEREYDIVSQIKGALIYPIFVVGILIAVVLMVMFGVMPRLVDLLKETGTTKPPWFTTAMINFYSFLSHYGWIVLLAFLCFFAFAVYYLSTTPGKKNYDKISLRIPVIGEFLKKIFLMRFAEGLSTLISAGLSINSALKITKETVENYVYRQIFSEVEKGVSEGERVSAILMKYPKYAPPFVVQMIQVGEETGKLDKNLMEIVTFYQKEVKRSVDTFTELIEPVLIIFLGIIVAFLAISVLQPLYGALGTI